MVRDGETGQTLALGNRVRIPGTDGHFDLIGPPADDAAEPRPERGGAVEAWVERWRDRNGCGGFDDVRRDEIDAMLADLRERADIGASWSDQLDDEAERGVSNPGSADDDGQTVPAPRRRFEYGDIVRSTRLTVDQYRIVPTPDAEEPAGRLGQAWVVSLGHPYKGPFRLDVSELRLVEAARSAPDTGSDPDECDHADMLARIAEAAGTEPGPQFMADVVATISYGRLWGDIRRAWPGPVGALHRAHVEGQDCPLPDSGGDEPLYACCAYCLRTTGHSARCPVVDGDPGPRVARSVPGQQPGSDSGAVAEIRREIAWQLGALDGAETPSTPAMRRVLSWAQDMVDRVAREHAVPGQQPAPGTGERLLWAAEVLESKIASSEWVDAEWIDWEAMPIATARVLLAAARAGRPVPSPEVADDPGASIRVDGAL